MFLRRYGFQRGDNRVFSGVIVWFPVTKLFLSFCQIHFPPWGAGVAGVPLVFVTAAYTSKTCPVCNHISKRNRPTRDSFRCGQCGFASSADHVEAIAFKGEVIRPIVSRMFFDLNHVQPQLQGSGL
ncbi:MAG: hypothetical protein C3F06_04985 [Candidatus Methanoperedenaceae archaeon]|nr:MAG: hypothetical protein C3F06_04985 [Candidatus Methanoperedenaceae archaeon]